MWIQGRIHGNEPFGIDFCLDLIKSQLSLRAAPLA